MLETNKSNRLDSPEGPVVQCPVYPCTQLKQYRRHNSVRQYPFKRSLCRGRCRLAAKASERIAGVVRAAATHASRLGSLGERPACWKDECGRIRELEKRLRCRTSGADTAASHRAPVYYRSTQFRRSCGDVVGRRAVRVGAEPGGRERRTVSWWLRVP